MKCKFCGAEIGENAAICPKCGNILNDRALHSDDEDDGFAEPVYEEEEEGNDEHCGEVPPARGNGKPPKKRANACAIVGFIFSFFPVLNVIGLILSAVGISKAKTLGTGKGLAIAGLVISIVEIVLIIIAMLLALFFGGTAWLAQSCTDSCSGACSDFGASCGDSLSDSLSQSCNQ